jgi:hypothetical protein
MGSTKIEAPERNYRKETRETLQAQLDLMPEIMAAERKYQPMRADMRMSLSEKMTPRLLALYENEITPTLSRIDARATRSQREADLRAVQELGPGYTEALMDADPERAGLLRKLTSQADEELSLGGRLSAAEQRAIQQDVMGNRSAMGMGYGPSDAAYLSLAQMQGRQGRKRERQQFAGGVAQMRTQMLGDPFMQITGRPSRVGYGSGAGIYGQTQGMSPGNLFNPESQYAGNLASANAQAKLAASTAMASNKAQMIGAGLGAVGDMVNFGN